jgi:hypothetical protein
MRVLREDGAYNAEVMSEHVGLDKSLPLYVMMSEQGREARQDRGAWLSPEFVGLW